MTHQLALMQCQQQPRAPRPFFERFGYLGLCILPDEVLDDTPLVDPETGALLPSLRQRASANGISYARVLRSCSPGTYWAEVSAGQDLADNELVVLTEEQLAYALAWDIRLQGKSPAHIRHILFACASESSQGSLPASHVSPEAFIPAPAVLLAVTEPIEVSTQDLQRVVIPDRHIYRLQHSVSRVSRPISIFAMQQGLLKAMLTALKQHLSQVREQAEVRTLQAHCALVTQMQQWHRKTRQRVIHLAQDWSKERRSMMWYLTLGVPESILAKFFNE